MNYDYMPDRQLQPREEELENFEDDFDDEAYYNSRGIKAITLEELHAELITKSRI